MANVDLCGTVMRTSQIISDLRADGLRIVLGNDFSEYAEIRATIPTRAKTYPMFDIESSYVDETNGFWMCGFNEQDELVHTQAARLLDLEGITLGRHLELHKTKYITPDTTPDPRKTRYEGPRGLSLVTGRVCYNGDFWIATRGLAGQGGISTTQRLSQLVFELARKQWNIDYTFAIIPQRMAQKGLQIRYGFTNCERGRWIGPDEQVTEEDYLAWMSGEDLYRNIVQSHRTVTKPKSLETI